MFSNGLYHKERAILGRHCIATRRPVKTDEKYIKFNPQVT